MQKNAFFAPFSSMLGNHGNNESLVPSSNTSTELHINNNSYNRAFFPTTQLCDGFQLTGFSQPNQKLAKPTPSPGGFTMTPVSGYKGGGRSDTVTSSGTQSRIDFKLMFIGDPMEEAAILGTHGAKRHKASPGEEKHHFPCLSSESALIQTQTPSRRSQKLGDKITALQQLVSPFGKTDTASVLHEATVCIKILHEQIQVLSSPYFRSNPLACQQEHDEQSEGLRGRGLCLVPVSHIINLSDQAASPIGSRSP